MLFLGNSRLQYRILHVRDGRLVFCELRLGIIFWGSLTATNILFAEELLRQIRPRAKVYVINVDDNFFSRYGEPRR